MAGRGRGLWCGAVAGLEEVVYVVGGVGDEEELGELVGGEEGSDGGFVDDGPDVGGCLEDAAGDEAWWDDGVELCGDEHVALLRGAEGDPLEAEGAAALAGALEEACVAGVCDSDGEAACGVGEESDGGGVGPDVDDGADDGVSRDGGGAESGAVGAAAVDDEVVAPGGGVGGEDACGECCEGADGGAGSEGLEGLEAAELLSGASGLVGLSGECFAECSVFVAERSELVGGAPEESEAVEGSSEAVVCGGEGSVGGSGGAECEAAGAAVPGAGCGDGDGAEGEQGDGGDAAAGVGADG